MKQVGEGELINKVNVKIKINLAILIYKNALQKFAQNLMMYLLAQVLAHLLPQAQFQLTSGLPMTFWIEDQNPCPEGGEGGQGGGKDSLNFGLLQ